jgi:hypothetical protein
MVAIWFLMDYEVIARRKRAIDKQAEVKDGLSAKPG